MHNKSKFAICLGIILLTPLAALSQVITIDGDELGGRVSPKLFGGGLVYSHEKDDDWNEDVYGHLYRMRRSFMRYPGGEVTSFFRWDNPTGSGWVDSWSPNFSGEYSPDSDFMDFDEYLEHTKNLNMFPLVGINIESGHRFKRVAEGIQEAKNFVAYAKSKGGVDYWFIDNESYHPNSNARLKAEEYAGYINQYVPAMREVDPDIKTIVNWKSRYWAGSLSQHQLEGEWKRIFRLAKDNINIVDVHNYWGWGDNGSWGNYLANETLLFNDMPYKEYLKGFRKTLDLAGLGDVELGVFEWGVAPSEQNESLTGSQVAIIATDMFMEILASDVVDFAAYWPIRWGGSNSKHDKYGFLDEQYDPTSVQKMLSMFSPLKGGHYLSDAVSDIGTIKVVAGTIKAESEIYIFLLNRSASDENVTLNILDIESYSVKAISSQGALERDLTNGELEWSAPFFEMDNESLNVKLPAWSLSRIALEK